MNKKLYWGFAALMILFLIAFVFMMQRERAEIQKLKAETDAAEKQLQAHEAAKEAAAAAPKAKKPLPPGETEESGHWHGDHWHRTAPMPQTAGTTDVQASLPEDASDRFIGPKRQTLDELKVLKAQIDSISARVQEKYPEFQVLASLTPEQLDARYPTAADREVLLQRAQNFLSEFLQEIKDVFADTPLEIRQMVFRDIYTQFTQSWGPEVADTITGILSEILEE